MSVTVTEGLAVTNRGSFYYKQALFKKKKKKFSRKTPHLSITNQLSLIDSAISKRQGDRRKHSFLGRKKILHQRENGE